MMAPGTSLIRSLLDQCEEIVVVMDCASGVVLECNETLFRMSGRQREEVLGKRVQDLHFSFPLQTPALWADFLRRVAEQNGVTVDTQFSRSDGARYPVRLTLTIGEHAGQRYLLAQARPSSSTEPLQSRYEREITWQRTLFQMTTHPAVASGEFAEAAAFIAATGRAAFPADHCSIWRLEGDLAHLVVDHAGHVVTPDRQPIHLARYPWLIDAMRDGRAADFVSTSSTDEQRARTQQLLERCGCKALLCAPVRSAGQTQGILVIGTDFDRAWQPDEISFAAELADQVTHSLLGAERRRAERELRTSQERYRTLVEVSSEAVWRVEFDCPLPLSLPPDEQFKAILKTGFLADCNDALACFFGLERADQLAGARLSALLTPLDEARQAEVRKAITARYQVTNLETHFLVGGTDRWALRNMVPVIEDGHLVRLWGATRDITERKRAEELLRQSEQRYRAFVANSSEGIFRIEMPEPIPVDLPPDEVVRRSWETGIIAECNLAMARLRGYESPEAMIGRPAVGFRLGTPEEWEQEVQFVRQGFRIQEAERPARTAGGAPRWFSYSATGVVERGGLVRVWGRVSDITARKALEAELRALSSWRATILEQERTRIAREIHDELGQQLTALKFQAAAWEKGAQMPVRGELTNGIDDAIQTVRRIATELRPAILDHFGLAAAVEWQAAELSRRAGLECECEIESGLAVEKSLATTVFRILQEALTNAARHSAARHIQVKLHRTEDRLELVVKDDGQGMRAAGPAGLQSLGLIGMRERAADEGGDIEIASRPGEGTTVSAWFPWRAAAGEAEPGARQ